MHESTNDNLPPPIIPIIKAKPLEETEDGNHNLATTNLFPFENTVNADLQLQNEQQPAFTNFYEQNLQLQPMGLTTDKHKTTLQLNITPCVPDLQTDLSFDNQSLNLDEQQSGFLELSNVNYDIDFSDLSAENSVAEELTPEKHKSPSFTPDPFSPIGSSCNIAQTPLLPSSAPLLPTSTASETMANPNQSNDFFLPATEIDRVETILDQTEEMCTANLPTPLKPTTSQYSGFSKQGWQIPSIPCNTGDYSSLNLSQSQAWIPNSNINATNPDKNNQNNDEFERQE